MGKKQRKTGQKQDGRGGAREGAGRKKVLADGSIRTAVVLPPEIVAWLDKQPGTRSEVIREVLAKAAKSR